MADKLQELKDNFAKISKQTQEAYDKLHGVGGRGGLEQSFLIAKRNYDNISTFPKWSQDDIRSEYKKFKPLFEAAQKEYADAQNQKNELRKQLADAEKAATAEKEAGIKAKSAENVYTKALSDLSVAETKLPGYKGTDNYITAYKAAQTAYDAAVKAGKNPAPLPEPKVPIITATGGNQGGAGGGGTDQGPEKPLNEVIDFLANPANKTILQKVQTDLKRNFPSQYSGSTDGKWSLDFQNALGKVAGNRAMVPKTLQGTNLLDFIAAPTVDLGMGGTGTGTGTPSVTEAIGIWDPTQAKSYIEAAATKALGREATADEVAYITKKLQNAQAKNPTTTTYTVKNGKKIAKTTGGLDETQFITDLLETDKKFAAETAALKQTAPDLTKRLADKKIYDDLVTKAAGDPKKLQEAMDTTTYGRGLKEFQASLANAAFSKGLTNTPDELNAIAKDLYDKGVAPNSQVATDAIAKIAKYGPNEKGRYTGTAGTTFDDLQKTATANGLDLNKTFGSQLPDWIAAIDKGESIDTYKKVIRDTAKIGMPDNVKKLLDNGVDLQAIYTPYKNLMASTLEINPQTIDLNDPTLRSAITADKEIPLYDFERQLRKDNRWQYTQQANQEVADATQQILKDFGFMG